MSFRRRNAVPVIRKNVLFFSLCFLVSVLTAAPLLDNGHASYEIVLPDQPHSSETRIAGELAGYLQKLTGGTFAVVSEAKHSETLRGIYVGHTNYAAKQMPNDLTEEEWIIRTDSNDNLLLTGGLRGTLYAVYDYLEREAGVRRLDSAVEIIPFNPALAVKPVDRRRKPSFAFRRIYDSRDNSLQHGAFKEFNKGYCESRNDTGIERILGGNRPHHTFGDLANGWPADHVWLFTRDAQGKAMIPQVNGGGRGQICMTHPEARSRTLAKLREYILRDRKTAAELGVPAPQIYDVSQNDNHDKCTCPACKALAEKEDSWAAPQLDFVNYLADELQKEFPGIKLRTFAYDYTQKPPKFLRASDNVIVQVAILGCEAGAAFFTYDALRPFSHPVNASSRELLMTWGTKASYLAWWAYWVIFPTIPEPYVNVRSLAEDLPFAYQHGVRYFFTEQEQLYFHNFSALTRYLGYKLLDDINAPAEPLIEEFLQGYYGKAAPVMGKLLKYMEQRQNAWKYRLADTDVSCRDYLDDDYFNTVFTMMAQAEEVVQKDADVLRRVRREYPALLGGLFMRLASLKEQGKWDTEKLLKLFHDTATASMEDCLRDEPKEKLEAIRQELAGYERKFAAAVRFDNVPKEVCREDVRVRVFNTAQIQYGKKCETVSDAGAVLGQAYRIEDAGDGVVCSVWNWMDGTRLALCQLNDQILPRDGCYHAVKIGRIPFADNGRIHMLLPDTATLSCGFYRMGRAGDLFDLWLSAKRDGKHLWVDRIYLTPYPAFYEVKTPSFVQGRPFRMLPWYSFRSAGSAAVIADDPEALGGTAMVQKSDYADSGRTSFGVYHQGNKKTLLGAYYPCRNIPDEKYHWRKVGTFEQPAGNGYIYAGNGWALQCPLPDTFAGSRVSLYVSLKFTGPGHVRGSQKQNAMYVDALLLVQEK